MSAFLCVQQGFRPLDDSNHQIEIREGSENHGDHGIIVSSQSVNQFIVWQRCGRISLRRNPVSGVLNRRTSRRTLLIFSHLGIHLIVHE